MRRLLIATLLLIGCTKQKPTLVWPIDEGNGIITSHIGPRWGRMHTGIDIGARQGTAIRTSGDGVVSSVLNDKIFGNRVIIFHEGLNLSTSYSHCQEIFVKEGDKVKIGDVIASVGRTGKATGPHLHFEVHYGNVFMNPEVFLVAHSFPLKLPFPPK